MTGYITHMAAREHVNDLLREAETRRRACPLPLPRPRKFTFPRLAIRRAARAATVGS